jgi:protein-tyrosine phosphatase
LSVVQPTKTVLFLCTGNYYRSRFAEILFNHHAERHHLNWRADSRGLALEFGIFNIGPISEYALAWLAEQGIGYEEHLRLPMRVSEADLARADLIVAVKEAEHRPLLQQRFRGWADRVEYWHIHDLDGATPQEALAGIEREVVALASRLQNPAGRLTSEPDA